jgi:uncharacterized ParB-like nuclease family protein
MAKERFDFSEEAELTNQQLADELAKLTPMTVDELNKLLPELEDKQKFQQLIDIVGKAGSDNAKIAALTSNIGQLGGVAVKVLGALLKLA